MMRGALLPIVLLGLPGAAAPSDKTLARELAGRVAGKPVDCIDLSRSGGPQVVNERTILYRDGGGRRIWKNDLPDACRGLDPMDTIVIDVFGGQLCRNDSFRGYSAGSSIPGPICRLGNFTPYNKPPKPKS